MNKLSYTLLILSLSVLTPVCTPDVMALDEKAENMKMFEKLEQEVLEAKESTGLIFNLLLSKQVCRNPSSTLTQCRRALRSDRRAFEKAQEKHEQEQTITTAVSGPATKNQKFNTRKEEVSDK